MGVDLQYDGVASQLAESVRRFLGDHELAIRAAGGGVEPTLWRGLAGLGVLGLAAEDEAALLVCACMEELGRTGFSGPLTGTFVATHLLGADTAQRLVGGAELVSVGVPPLMPWAPVASIFVELAPDGGRAWSARNRGLLEPVETLAGEPWGRCTLERMSDLGDARDALALGDAALGAYLVGAGERLLELATAHAAQRVQFGRSLGDFQAVSHPLAECATRLAAARALARVAAHALAGGDPAARQRAATARLSATEAALAIAYQALQTHGALGFTVEGPVARLATRIRQCSLLAPGPAVARQTVLAGLSL